MTRVVVLLDTETFPKWVSKSISGISELPKVELVGIAHFRIPQQKGSFYFDLFKKIDHSFWPIRGENLSLNTKELSTGLALLPLDSSVNESIIQLTTNDLQKIASLHPDLILYFGSNGLRGRIVTLAQHGLWKPHFGNVAGKNSLPIAFREWLTNEPATSISILRIKDQEHEGTVLSSTLTRTILVSYSRNLNTVLSKGIDLLIDTVRRFEEKKEFRTINSKTQISDSLKEPKIRYDKYSKLFHFLAALFILFLRAAFRASKKILFFEPWVIFISLSKQNITNLDFKTFKALLPPKDRIWADPFVVSAHDKHYVFIEEMFNKSNRAHLSCLTLNLNGEIESSAIILEKPYHLSYPNIFLMDGIWYMIPESSENKTVDLYECVEFPHRWELKCTLLYNIVAMDTTLHFADDKYWLFCSVQNRLTSSPNDDLYIFFSDDVLSGNWTPHACNPVISDPFNARPAGKFFFHDGSWFRPSQVCVPDYGYAVSLNRILELTETNFEEDRMAVYKPGWYSNLRTMHTLNFTSEVVVVDGILRRSRIFSR